jgi:hypothetical protein
LRRVDLRLRRGRLRAARGQKHTDEAKPKRHPQQKEHDPPIIPGALFAAFKQKLADSVELAVGNEARLLSKIDANASQFFVKFDLVKFGSNFTHRLQVPRKRTAGGRKDGYRNGKTLPLQRRPASRSKTNFTMTAE